MSIFDSGIFDPGIFDAGGAGVPVDKTSSIVGVLPSLTGTITTYEAQHSTMVGALPSLSGFAGSLYSSGTQRPTVGQALQRWQDAVPQDQGAEQRWQDTVALPTTQDVRWQDGADLFMQTDLTWVDALRMGNDTDVRYQQADKLPGPQVDGRWQDGIHYRQSKEGRYQQANKMPGPQFDGRWQDGIHHRHGKDGAYQDALRLRAVGVEFEFSSGVVLWQSKSGRYQDARFVSTGISERPVVIPGGGGEEPPPPGALVIVPVKRVYIVLNTATLRRVEGDLALPLFAMSLSLDVDSWTWSFSASLPGRALPDIEPDSDGTPVEVEALLNGVAYRFLLEKIGRERAFAQDGLRVSGRGINARLDAPYAPSLSFGNDEARTARQLMDDVLTDNGVPLGWEIDWQIEDWNVPAGNWHMQGSYIAALNNIVGAAGGYLQPTPAGMGLKALLRYPALPWAWADVTPDFELPSAAMTRESIEWTEKARYTRVYVSGQGPDGRTGRVTREGTEGVLVAPDITDPLITDTVAARQRGGAILADTGRIAMYQLRTAAGVRDTLNNPVGIIPPGKFLRYNDNGVLKLGITRSVNVEVQMPDIFQTIGVETHESL